MFAILINSILVGLLFLITSEEAVTLLLKIQVVLFHVSFFFFFFSCFISLTPRSAATAAAAAAQMRYSSAEWRYGVTDARRFVTTVLAAVAVSLLFSWQRSRDRIARRSDDRRQF